MKTAILEQVGLTRKEAEVYETLLKLGEVPISAVLKATSSHPQVIYSTIESLTGKGLVTALSRRNRKYVRAEDPEILLTRQKDRLRELDEAMPQLRALRDVPPNAVVRLSRGNEAVRALRMRQVEETPPGGTDVVIGGSGEAYWNSMGPQRLEYERKRINKGICKRLVTFESQRDFLEQPGIQRELAEFRYLPERHGIPSTTMLFQDTTAIVIWEMDPIVITIESEGVTKSYRNYFESLWKIALA
jgi:sugar-specific transcriptional regulator TrmB